MRFTAMIVLTGMILSGGTVFGNSPTPVPQEEMVARVYDISSLNSPPGEYTMSGLFECLFPFTRNDSRQDHGGEEYFSAETIIDFISQFYESDDFDREGVEFVDYERQLFVMGPESLHRKIILFLQFLEDRMNHKVILDIEAYVTDRVLLAEEMTPEAIRLAADKGKGLHTVLKTSRECRMGERMSMKWGSEKNIVWDYDTEIAQGSVMLEPVVAPLFLGLSLDVRPKVSPDDKKIQLTLFCRYARLLEPLQRRNGAFSGRLSTENSINIVHGDRSMDDPKIEFAGAAATLLAQPGKPVLLSAAFPHHRGLGSLVLVLTAHMAPVPHELDLGEGRILSARNVGFLDKPLYFCSHLIWDECFRSFSWSEIGDDEDPTLVYLGSPGKFILNAGRLEAVNQAYQILEGGDFLIPEDEESFVRRYYSLGYEYFLLASRAFHDLSKPVLDGLLATGSSTVHIELKCVEHHGLAVLVDEPAIEQQGTLVGILSLPLAHGCSARSMAGFEGLMIRNYEVDVATSSGAACPNVVGFLDGAFISLDHVPACDGARGNGQVRAILSLNRLKDSDYTRDMGEGRGVLGILDAPEFDRAFMDSRFAVDGEPHMLGSLTRTRDGQVKTLYVIGRAVAK